MESLELRRLLSTTWYVDAAASGPTHDGTSWGSAYTDLQQALASSAAGDAIHVAQGTYKPTSTTDRTISFQLKTGVEIDGGYAGSTSATPDARDVAAYPTILSGDIGTPGDNADNSYHVVNGSGVDSTAVLDGVTITGGNATGTGTDQGYGGGVLDVSGSPTLANCEFLQNNASSGGALYNSSSSAPTLSRCNFADNQAVYSGGGAILDDHSSPNVTNCAFTGNDGGGSGGAIYNISSSPTFVDCAFSGNRASLGAAIGDYNSSPGLINCTIAGNTAQSIGGAIYDENNSASVLTNCVLWGNAAPINPEILGANTHASFSDIEHGYSGARNVDPLFYRNPSPGSDGQWGTSDDDFGDLRLQPCSPVADAGNTSAVPSGVTTDLAGNSRFQDIPTAPNNGGGIPVDIGAYEAVPSLFVSAGGTYYVAQGKSITLTAHGASNVAGSLQYAWDLDNNGVFDNGTGARVVFANTSALGTQSVAVRMTDAASHDVTTAISIIVVQPVLYVDASAPGPVHDGSSWPDAYNDLQEALSIAVAGQQIEVARGIYLPSGTLDPNPSFHLKSGVSIYGGYAGYGTVDPDARDLTTYKTTLSGNLGSVQGSTISSYHVLNGSYADSSAILDGVTVTGGTADGGEANADGGGMLNVSGSPTLSNCIFTDNAAETNGGGIANYSSSPAFSGCTFSYNIGDFNGGGAYNDGTSTSSFNTCTFMHNTAVEGGGAYNDSGGCPTFIDCMFSNNAAVNNGNGGGMENDGASATVTNCVFTDNTASDEGGGIQERGESLITGCTFSANAADFGGGVYNDHDARINGCTFVDNIATGPGGGIANDSYSSPTITNCRFVGNSAEYGGGAADFNTTGISSDFNFSNCSFIDNSATTWGGGLYISDSTSAPSGPPPSVVSCTFLGNLAEYGGGIYAVSNTASSTVYIINCSVIVNSANIGGGVYSALLATGAKLNVQNCIIWGNIAPYGPQGYGVGNSITLQYTDLQGITTATNGNINADPMFYRNPSPGADGTWATADDDYGDLRLLPNSPCIDAGYNPDVPYTVTTDIAGNPRIVDFPGVKAAGAIVDMGAYEANTDLGAMHLTAGQNVVLPAGHHVFSVTSLTIDPGASLDLKDDSLVLDYSGSSPLGSWDGGSGAYTGINGMIESGAIFSSLAQSKYTTISAAEASDVLSLNGSATATWGGQTVDSTSVLIKFTYAGDANLDGKVNIDDYGRIDGNVGASGSVFGWYNGDFNYDGKVNIDDYGLIDSVIGTQGAVL